ncbi:MAG: chorismate mutase [Actinomycetes bacterium]|nr:chorismate mutase [Actinomycetes bacterium]
MSTSKPDSLPPEISDLRAHLDELDEQLVALLNKRAQTSLKVWTLRGEAGLGRYDPRREEEILQHVAQVNEGPLFNQQLRDIYHVLFTAMRKVGQL